MERRLSAEGGANCKMMLPLDTSYIMTLYILTVVYSYDQDDVQNCIVVVLQRILMWDTVCTSWSTEASIDLMISQETFSSVNIWGFIHNAFLNFYQVFCTRC